MLTLDLSPQQDADGRWFISISQENGDAEAYAYFDSEAEAESFINALTDYIEQPKGE